MAETESSISIQDEGEDELVASVIRSSDDNSINGVIGLNPDGSSVNPVEEEEE